MRTVSYRLVDLQKAVLNIGKVGENDYTRVMFDSKKLFEEYPSAIPSLAVVNPSGTTYPAVVTRDGDFVYWDVSDADLTVQGNGELQLTFINDGVVAKTYIAKTRIDRSLVPNGEAPDPITNWIDEANEALGTIEGAVQQAEDARDAAVVAQGKAEDAQGLAETAQGKAEDAQGHAEDAQTAAETAQGLAEGARDSAQGYASDAESARDLSAQWATGGTSGTPSGTNNSKYYSEQASDSADSASRSAGDASGYATTASNKAGEASQSASSASGSATSANDDALKAEGHAVGKQDGTDVGSSSPYYHNNAKYYKEQASSSATNAGNSATSAGQSATSAGNDALKAEGYAVGKQNGTDVASGSPYYENNAKYYADQAESVLESIPEDYTALSNDVSNVKSAINVIETSVYETWESGNYKSSDGTKNENTSRIRNDLLFGIPTGCQKVESTNGFEICIYAWDASGTFKGSYHTDGTFQTNGNNIAWVTEFDCSMFSAYSFKIAVKDSSGSSNITTADGANIHYQFCDETLTEKYKAADAKKVGDKISDINTAIIYNTGNQKYTYTNDKYINTSSSPVNINSQEAASGYAYTIADCTEGDVFYVSGRGSLYAALWTFIDSSGVIKSQSTSTTGQTNEKITAPAGATKLIAQTNRPNPKLEKGLPLVSRVGTLENEYENIDEYVDAVKIFEQHGNILDGGAVSSLTGKYYYRSGTNLAIGTNAAYDGFIVPVDKNKLYTMTTANVVLLDENKQPLAGSGSWDYESVTSCSSGNAAYFALSYRLDAQPQAGYAISEGTAVSYDDYSVEYFAKTKSSSEISHVVMASGEIASGGYLTTGGYTTIKDDEQIVFKGKFSSFDALKIDFYATGSTNHVTVNGTNLVIVNTTDNTITQPHGLTIANEITVLLELKDGNMYVSVTSMGVTYKYHCAWNQTGGTSSKIYARSVDMAFTSAKLSISYHCATRGIWYFGDSYIAFGTDTRIPYYMDEYGYMENVMWNGVSGGTTAVALQSFNELLKYGKPKIAILATGMNDGSDGDTAVYGWITRVPTFIAICESNGIIPILCTIPTVPSVNNEKKNAWVKSSGKRYIDYASAVGANSSGAWYTGMLSSDNVHPSTLGGNALFTQLLSDVPEVMGK